MNKSWYEKEELFLEIKESLDIDIPLSVSQKVMELQLLYGIPLPYLIPHPDLLPQESIRYFCIDQNWVWALLDGFCSVGRMKPTDLNIDNSFLSTLYRKCSLKKHQIREKLLHQNVTDELLESHEVSGILLHSSIVSLYKGLEIRGFNKHNYPLTMLRMEKIQRDIIICLFAGELEHVIISEPKESVSYGLFDDRKIYVKNLKTGETGDEFIIISGNDRKIDVSDFVKKISHYYKEPNIHSGHLAIELIKNQQEGEIHFVTK